MFIDCAKLEKILKADYKTWGVKFGLTEKGIRDSQYIKEYVIVRFTSQKGVAHS